MIATRLLARMTNWKSLTTLVLTAALTGTAVGLRVGWALWRPKPAPQEIALPAVVQRDGSRVLERIPDPKARPANLVPKDGKVERIVQVTVQPATQVHGSSETGAPLPPSCVPSPVRVDLTLVRMPDGTRRVVASSPDGEVTGGIDIPTVNMEIPKILSHAIGLRYEVTSNGGKSWGPVYHQDFRFVRLSIDACTTTIPQINKKELRVGTSLLIRF